MPNYQDGKIYKLTGAGKVYIGSTTMPLYKRHWRHKNAGILTVQDIISDQENQITLIELFPCSSKEELLARERYHIENTECINKIRRPMRTDEEKQNHYEMYGKTEKAKEYQKMRNSLEITKQSKAEYKKTSEKYKEYAKEYTKQRRQTPEYKAYQKEYNRQYRERKKSEQAQLS